LICSDNLYHTLLQRLIRSTSIPYGSATTQPQHNRFQSLMVLRLCCLCHAARPRLHHHPRLHHGLFHLRAHDCIITHDCIMGYFISEPRLHHHPRLHRGLFHLRPTIASSPTIASWAISSPNHDCIRAHDFIVGYFISDPRLHHHPRLHRGLFHLRTTIAAWAISYPIRLIRAAHGRPRGGRTAPGTRAQRGPFP
jgi:hypothetical protein